MIVRDCMTTTVQVVHPEDDVATVRETFRRRRIRQLPVVAAGRVIGIISDRDVRTAVDGHTTVDTLMTPTPLTTSPSTPVEVAATMLRTRKIGALPVVEGEVLVGIVSESDLLGALVALCAQRDPTTVLELECADDPEAATRASHLLECRGGTVGWLTAIRTHGGRQRINLRVRMPSAQTPEQLLEEAGFTVVSARTC